MEADGSTAASALPRPPSPIPSAPSAAPPAVGLLGGSNNKPPQMDSKAWSTIVDSINKVQYLLDNNRLLLHEINLNQESKIPDSLTRNIHLTRLLNDNISKVVELYSKISDTCVTFGIQMNL
jgi:hypothetical protein